MGKALLPAESPLFRFTSCAVVGNSGALLRQRLGADIDAHGAVFRINQAPTAGFEAGPIRSWEPRHKMPLHSTNGGQNACR